MNAEYQSRLVGQTLIHFGKKLFLPYPVRAAITAVKSAKYLYQGAHCLLQRKIEVSVLDAVAIGVSVFRGEMNTAASVMYLLGIGETLEEWTHKKSVDDLARSSPWSGQTEEDTVLNADDPGSVPVSGGSSH